MIDKQINSKFGVTLKSCIIEKNSDTLAVLLPGIGYTNDRPLLDYSKRLCLELGYDVLPIEYGFQAARIEYNIENVNANFDIILNESRSILNLSLDKKYKKIVFIGKSFGTLIQRFLCDDICNKYSFKNIYLTPINRTVELGISKNSLVISGTNDPLLSKEYSNKLKEIADLNVLFVPECDHSLNVKNDTIRSIDYLKQILTAQKKYLLQK